MRARNATTFERVSLRNLGDAIAADGPASEDAGPPHRRRLAASRGLGPRRDYSRRGACRCRRRATALPRRWQHRREPLVGKTLICCHGGRGAPGDLCRVIVPTGASPLLDLLILRSRSLRHSKAAKISSNDAFTITGKTAAHSRSNRVFNAESDDQALLPPGDYSFPCAGQHVQRTSDLPSWSAVSTHRSTANP
jgi:hypothetical protein